MSSGDMLMDDIITQPAEFGKVLFSIFRRLASIDSWNIAVLGVEPLTRGLRALIPLPLTLKTKRHFLSAFFIAGAGFEPATFGL